jgi:hypothetical protein
MLTNFEIWGFFEKFQRVGQWDKFGVSNSDN